MPPLRVLHIVPAMNMGGMETFIMNLYRNIDRQQVQFDYLTHYATPSFYDAEIEELGGRIHRLSVRENHRFFHYLGQLNQFFTQHPQYTVVHGHYSSFGMFYNHYAQKHGVQNRIGHSHSTHYEKGLAGQMDRWMSRFFRYGLTQRLACSQAAGRFLFGGYPFEVVPNAIELEKFAFSAAERALVRTAHTLPQKAIVYGHVGRFSPVKNHRFLLRVFAHVAAQQPNAHLLLLGEGPLQAEIKQQAAQLGLQNKVVFAGLQANPASFYSAMDAFLLPSHFEGIPLVMIEAQAAGLPCFVSAAVSREAGMAGTTFLPLEEGEEGWAKQLVSANLTRNNNIQKLTEAGYDSKACAARMQAFYLAQGKGLENHEC